ncbi:met-10 domain-containing protein, putative [Eimeria tenella]|uniref:tRNA (guanine(37)-N1)-methyltransferase n=1 Tax=Eimeria tenella TaxID=5802 RepID=U6L1Q3_EIMTE|nr:met-10 domain-containing protein, putative [Eimeria tenella]CDJ43123.1 met-10 domain-containing protein, putative [Eimeria tenella]|eukprot:XP_013233873.1 met-10 domain-containing protein, putative [Eimeria tenella]
MPSGTVQYKCLRHSSGSSRNCLVPAAETTEASPAAAPTFLKGLSFLKARSAGRSSHGITNPRCFRVAATAACAAALLQPQQQAWMRYKGGNDGRSSLIYADALTDGERALPSPCCSGTALNIVLRQQEDHQHQQVYSSRMPPYLHSALSNGGSSDAPAVGGGGAAEAQGKPSDAALVTLETDTTGFVQLNKDAFCKEEEVTCLRVPLNQLQELSKALRKYLFKRRNLRPVVSDIAEKERQGELQQEMQNEQQTSGDGDAGQQELPQHSHDPTEVTKEKDSAKGFKCLLLDPSIGPELDGLPEDLQSQVRDAGIEVLRHRVSVGYENLSAVECLTALLPEGAEVPHRFECVGHIAHLNLPATLLKFKYAIGQVVLDKHPQLRTVVLKTGIGEKWRELQFELIAGEAAYVATVKESDMIFEVDYAKAFWNSRLSCERQRITAAVPKDSVVLDAFAGVGAFAVYLARSGCIVAANDGNPASAMNMRTNVKRNGVADLVEVHNQDARDFLRTQGQPEAIATLLDKRTHNRRGHSGLSAAGAAETWGSHRQAVEVHVIMNLPELAVEFLDVFPGLFNRAEPQAKRRRPTEGLCSATGAAQIDQISKWRVHCYAFCRDPKPEQDLKPRVEAALGYWPDSVEIHEVRDVAPHKRMYCLTFDIPPLVLRGEPEGSEGQEDQHTTR